MFKRNILIIAFCFCLSVISGWESYADENAESLINQARSLYQEKEYHKSKVLLQEIVEKYPGSEVSVQAKAAIVDCYQKLKDYNLAIEYGNKYLKDYPDHDFAENVELIIARSLLRKEQYDEAKIKYKEFINRHKGSDKLDEAYYFLGTCYEEPARRSRDKRKLLKQALTYYSKVINDYPDSAYKTRAEDRIGMVYYDLRQYDQAIDQFKKYIEATKPDKLNGGTLYFLGLSYKKIGKIDEAKKTLNRIINDYPNTKWEEHAKKALNKILSE